MEVNWCEVTVTDTDQGKTIYHNAFATCHEISDQNVEELVVAGRARPKAVLTFVKYSNPIAQTLLEEETSVFTFLNTVPFTYVRLLTQYLNKELIVPSFCFNCNQVFTTLANF